MARNKDKKPVGKKFSFVKRANKSASKSDSDPRAIFLATLKVLIVCVVIGAIGVSFFYLERYVKKHYQQLKKANIELVDVPAWVSSSLEGKVYDVVSKHVKNVLIDEKAAKSAQQALEGKIVWLSDVKVQAGHDSLIITAKWRKPVASVIAGIRKFYVDEQLVVLDHVEMPNLPVVQVTGIKDLSRIPPAGQVWHRDDLAAAIEVLIMLDVMDSLVCAEKPLLNEIASIDVSNFNGRESTKQPHIILYATDKTEVIWGAEIGTWQRHLEATDEEKLNKLYSYYDQCGTLLNNVKYINLRNPQGKIPLPVDKY